MGASLWDPVRVGGLSLKNRAVMPAMGTGYASTDGKVTPRLVSFLKERAKGGVGLIITEVCAVHPLGRGFRAELGIYDESFLPGLENLAREVKREGAAVALQLHHAGRETFSQIIGGTPVAPSPVAGKALGQKPRALSREEIQELVGCYARAARRAREAGFDAVEVHGAHGYLINQFLSPYSNFREDDYGGDWEGRLRFAREVVREIKREAGRDFPVIFRLSASEEVKGGYDLGDILPLLPLLEREGVDAFHVSCGVIDSPGNPTCPGIHHPDAYNRERAAAVKSVVGVPVIVAGKVHRPSLAERIIGEGEADMVAFGRQHLADPRFLCKAADGKEEEIRLCLSCNQGCIERLVFEFKSVTCSINPRCGREFQERLTRGAGGSFLVVGAGPAGLQAAFTLREGGAERVVLVEKENEAGGRLRAASKPRGKEAYGKWVEGMVRDLGRLGVEIMLGTDAEGIRLEAGEWDGVVVATGADPVIPEVPGRGGMKEAEAGEVLLGGKKVRGRVIVVGAGLVGMETAVHLLEEGCRVIVLEEKETPPVSPLTSHGYFLHRLVREKGELRLGTKLVEIRKGGVLVEGEGGRREVEAEWIVWAVGSRPRRGLAEAAAAKGLRVEEAGDTVEPRRLLEAVHEGYEAAGLLLEKGNRR